ncbi:hypothetical protein FIM1_4837 [Kluyveromyces marxianus]|uniref:Uncharacterized protein n=1 Tax=Kluyveromyces marxianus TaxID=4911 RepID=A0ABX6EZ51_KLUMA|nr:hypothetical protein FIM1_4837 [Kluyveromyces marxianus]
MDNPLPCFFRFPQNTSLCAGKMTDIDNQIFLLYIFSTYTLCVCNCLKRLVCSLEPRIPPRMPPSPDSPVDLKAQKKRKHTVIAFFGYTSRYCILGHVYTMCQGRSFPKGKTLFFFIVSFSMFFGQSCRKTCERWAPSICQEPFRATQETRNKKQRKYKHRFIV